MEQNNQTEINQKQYSQYSYHHTRIADLEKILNTGLEPRIGIMSRLINEKKLKVFFSESMKGTIIMAAAFQETFDDIKMGTAWENRTFEEFLDARVFLRFNSNIVENENDTENENERDADGYTSKSIAPEHLRVCLLKNIQTGEISYQRDDILKYMCSINPIDSFDKELQYYIKKYYDYKFNGLEEYNSSYYSLEDIDLCEFFKKYITNGRETIGLNIGLDKESIFSPIEIGNDTFGIPPEKKNTARSQVEADMNTRSGISLDI